MTPCQICNNIEVEDVRDKIIGELSPNLEKRHLGSVEEKDHLRCLPCGKIFKSTKTLRKHKREFHPDLPNDQGVQEKRTKVHCPHCWKMVSDLPRHVKENCRQASENLSKCFHCDMMFPTPRLKEHMNGYRDKDGNVVKRGCIDKQREKKSEEKATKSVCDHCGKAMNTRYLSAHKKLFHQEEKLSNNSKLAGENVGQAESNEGKNHGEENPSKSDRTAKESGNKNRIFLTREMMQEALLDVQFEQDTVKAQAASEAEALNQLNQLDMIRKGTLFLAAMGINVEEPTFLILKNGDCLFSCAARAQNPSVGMFALQAAAKELREACVEFGLTKLDRLPVEKQQKLAEVCLEIDQPMMTVAQMRARLSEYKRSGQYQGKMGDAMPYLAAAKLKTPIMIIDIHDVSHEILAHFVNPEDIFGEERVTEVPIVVVRHYSHFEVLIPTERGRQQLKSLYSSCREEYIEYQGREQQAESGWKPSKADANNKRSGDGERHNLPGPSGQGSVSAPVCSSNHVQSGGGRHKICQVVSSFFLHSGRQQPATEGSSRDKVASIQSLLIPDKRIGDRKKVLDLLKHVHPSFESATRELLTKLDAVLSTGESAVDAHEQFELEKQPIFEMVLQYKQKKEGRNFKTPLTDLISAGRDSSSIYTWWFNIGQRILPFLKHHLSSSRPDFLLKDLFCFGHPRLVRITEDMVVACNAAIGPSASSKKSILASWEILFHSIELKARNSINEVNEEHVRRVMVWYQELRKDIGPGITRMGEAANRERSDRKSQEDDDYEARDELIQKWLQSEERASQKKALHELANRIRSDRSDVEIPPSVYTGFVEIVITEMSLYFPVRIGAIVRMTMRGFLGAKVAWSPPGEEMSQNARPVTVLPANACLHQRSAKTDIARMGFTETGSRCCEQAVLPIAYLMDNDQDKGGYSDNWILISFDCQGMLIDFILVREHYFSLHPPKDKTDIDGSCPLFLNSKGSEPPPTSNFKLNMLSAVVGQKMLPQDFRKWNTTALALSDDERVRRMRGAATGNSESVYQRYYNVARQAENMHCLLTSLQRHIREDDCTPRLSQEHEQRREKDRETLRQTKRNIQRQADGIDLTSQRMPVHRQLKDQFKEELDRVYPDLRARAIKDGKSSRVRLTEWAWIKEVITVLGRQDAEVLRDVILQQYQGEPDPMKRQWSGLLSHIENMKADIKGGKQCIR